VLRFGLMKYLDTCLVSEHAPLHHQSFLSGSLYTFPEVSFHLADFHPLHLVTRVPNMEPSSAGLHTAVAMGHCAMRGG
jgi:hypothetical protein